MQNSSLERSAITVSHCALTSMCSLWLPFRNNLPSVRHRLEVEQTIAVVRPKSFCMLCCQCHYFVTLLSRLLLTCIVLLFCNFNQHVHVLHVYLFFAYFILLNSKFSFLQQLITSPIHHSVHYNCYYWYFQMQAYFCTSQLFC